MAKVSFTTKGGKRVSFNTKSRKTSKPKRKTTKRRKASRSRKANKPKRRSKTVAKRRSSPRKKSGFGKIPLINNPTFRKAATGIGVATLGATVLGLVLPQLANQPLVKPILALAGGGVPGVVAQFLVQGGGNIGNLLGGGNGGNGGGQSVGFA